MYEEVPRDDGVREHALHICVHDGARDDEQDHKYEHILDNENVVLYGGDVRDYDCARDCVAKEH